MKKQKNTLTPRLSPRNARVLEHLGRTGEITGRDALLNLSIPNSSLNVAIFELRMAGYKIATDRRKNPVTGQRYAAFVLQ